jgi:hypothetical protein
MLDAELSGRPSKLNDKKLMDISDSAMRSPSKSLRKLAQEKDIGLATVSANKIIRVQTGIDARGHHLHTFVSAQRLSECTVISYCKLSAFCVIIP